MFVEEGLWTSDVPKPTADTAIEIAALCVQLESLLKKFNTTVTPLKLQVCMIALARSGSNQSTLCGIIDKSAAQQEEYRICDVDVQM